MIVPLVFVVVWKRKLKKTMAKALVGNAWVCHLAGSFSQHFLI